MSVHRKKVIRDIDRSNVDQSSKVPYHFMVQGFGDPADYCDPTEWSSGLNQGLLFTVVTKQDW